jgi:uncharacterized damage-inducible protein DinB
MISQITELLNAMDGNDYAKPLEIFNGSTLGQHFRHILEFYHCLLSGAERGTIDYAQREREPRIEQDPLIAKQAFQQVLHALDRLEERQALSVKADFSSENASDRPLVRSSVGRELMFAYDHAVHHLAIIKIGLQTCAPQFQMDPNLGVAPSTVKYRAGQ